jgi:hypothetical protein
MRSVIGRSLCHDWWASAGSPIYLRSALRAFNLQAQRIADLSTKLRLTRQSRQGARRGDQIARQGSGGRRPWTDWGLGSDDDAKQ